MSHHPERTARNVRPVNQPPSYFYDDWNLIEERIANANGTNTVIQYTWGKDLSGSLQGAGGVGGLLYLTVDGSVYVPLYDNNGNITHYCDATGAVVAAYTYDAFGNTITQSGDLAYFFRHRFSTKYNDTESGLYYYGYRFYHPTLMRWLNRDPIEEDGGVNLYGFCKNNGVRAFDGLGEARMITGALLALKNIKRNIYPGYGKARDIVRLVDGLNKKLVDGKKMFDAKICDFVTTPISTIKQEVEKNGDNVYLIAHGGLVVNGQPYRFTRYTWNKTDSVVERIYPDGKFDHGIDIASFGPGLNMQNVYGCYLSPHVRKVKSGGWFPEYTSSLDDYANMYEALFLRLKRYQTMKPSCKIVIRIYEGENANEANRSYAETDNVFEKWPIRDEEEYK